MGHSRINSIENITDVVAKCCNNELNRNIRITQTCQGSGAGSHFVPDKRINLAYNAIGQFTFISRYENVNASGTTLRSIYTYDQANRLTGLTHRNLPTSGGLTDLVTYAWQYDPMNRITSQTHTAGAGGVSDGVSTFSYDQTSQLTVADHAAARVDENHAYDLNGNRNSAGYTTGTNNQSSTSQDSAGQKYSYVYDKEGNRTQRTRLASNGTTVLGVEDYTWDHRNRLTNVTFRATVGGTVLKTVDYSYDIFNRLVKRSFDSNGPTAGGVTDTFFAGYDGINPTLELSKDNPGTGGVSPSDLKHRYLWGPVVDQLFADEQNTGAATPVTAAGNTLWPLGDQLGTLRDIADFNPGTTTFAITNHRTYDSFGRLTAESNTAVDVAFAYTGKFFDEVTGLSHHWNRWFDPNLGKWISEDPIGFEAGDTNLGRYVGNGVNGNSDPSGLEGVGQHWVPVTVINDSEMIGRLSAGAVDTALGTYSGATEPHHRNGTFDDVTHPEYNKVVKRRLNEHMKENGISEKNKMTDVQMDEFIKKIENGTTGNKHDDKLLKTFNDEIRHRRELFKSNNPDSKDPGVSLADRKEKGRTMRKARGVVSGLLIGGLIATATNEAIGALDVAATSEDFRMGVEALSMGDLTLASKHFVGSGNYFPNGGFAGDLTDAGYPNGSVRFQKWWLETLSAALQAEGALANLDE